MAVIGNNGVAKRMLKVITAVSTLAEYRSRCPSHNSTTNKTLLFYQVSCLLSSEAVFPEFDTLLWSENFDKVSSYKQKACYVHSNCLHNRFCASHSILKWVTAPISPQNLNVLYDSVTRNIIPLSSGDGFGFF
jgi:hypothetical protein